MLRYWKLQERLPILCRRNESFNGNLRDELLAREIFYTLKEAKVLIEGWRKPYNEYRPHSSLGYRPPAPQAVQTEAALMSA